MKHSSNAQISYAPSQVLMFRANLLFIILNIITFLANRLFVMTCLRLSFYCFHHLMSVLVMQADLVSVWQRNILLECSLDSDDAVLVPNCLCPIPKTVGGAIWIFYILYTNGLAALPAHWNLPIMCKIMKCSHILYLFALQQSWVAFDPLYLYMLSWLHNERIASDSQAHYFNGK